MGVKGLWTLLEPVGKPVTLESLEGKILAVDVSIWLHQTVHGMRDKHGDPVANAHLVGLFNRLCKLLFYKIKPIFVFDGGVPELKRQTLAARRQQRADATERSEQATRKLLTGLMKQHAVGSVLGGSGPSGSQPSTSGAGRRDDKTDIYELPPMPAPDPEGYVDEVERALDVRATFLDMLSQEFQDPEEIDPQSEEFKALPPEVQYEVLTEMKEFRKQKRWKNSTEMPETSEDFSNFQLKRIMHRSRLTTRLDDVRKEINAAASGDMVMQLTGSGPGQGVEARRLVSDDSSHYILVKGLRKASEAASKISSLEGLREEDFKDNAILDTIKNTQNANHQSPKTLDTKLEETKPIKDDHKNKDMKRTDSPNPTEKTISSNSAKSNMSRPSIIVYHSSETRPDRQASKSDPKTTKSVTKTRTPFREVPREAANSHPEVMLLDSDSDDGFVRDGMCVDQQVVEGGEAKSAGSRSAVDGAQVVPFDDSQKPSTAQSSDMSHEGGFIREESDGDSDVMDVNDVTNVNDVTTGILTDLSELRESKEPDASEVTDAEVKATCPDDVREINVNDVTEISDDDVSDINDVTKADDADTSVVPSTTESDRTSSMVSTNSPPTKTDQSNTERTTPEHHQEDSEVQLVSAEDADSSKSGTRSRKETLETATSTMTSSPGVATSSSRRDSAHSVSDDDFEEVAPGESSALELCYTPGVPQEVEEVRTDAGSPPTASHPTHHDTEGTDTQIVITDDEVDQHVLETLAKERNRPSPAKRPVISAEAEEQLSELQSQLEEEAQQLQVERGRLDRQAASITDTMTAEAQELLRLFGVPYLVSPMEAEAQCAQLDLSNHTEGTITDDSDIWLFGGRRVYKNMFNHGKYVEHFSKSSIESQLLLDRTKLINIAFLCGSDYTPGIERVGPVTAMEILAEFPGDGPEQLRDMKSWWNRAHRQPVGSAQSETKIKQKVRQLRLPSGFPSQSVVDAYLKPEVDDSEERFTWGKPDLDLLRAYAAEKLGWSQTKTDESLLPVLKKLSESSMQRHITSFFNMDFGEPRKLKSKRVKQVINKLQTKNRTEMNIAIDSSSSSADNNTRLASVTSNSRNLPGKSPSKDRTKPTQPAESGKRQAAQPRGQPAAKRARRGRGAGRRGRGGRGAQATPREARGNSGRQMVDEVKLSESSSDED